MINPTKMCLCQIYYHFHENKSTGLSLSFCLCQKETAGAVDKTFDI